jgi:hypothetical protein
MVIQGVEPPGTLNNDKNQEALNDQSYLGSYL